MIPDGMMGTFKVGDLIEVSGHRGTIRYIGDVVGTKGDWLGVDWDDRDRGKHDGTHNGVAYFKTRHPCSGSFIRPAKVTPAISCVEAIRSRYGLIEDNAGLDLQSLAQIQKDIRAKVFQVVGAEKVNKKQSKFDNLQIVSLRGQPINDPGPANSLSFLCSNIQELDLSKTLINSWSCASKIAVQLPHLRLLNLSENRLTIDSPQIDAFKNVQHLVLAQTGLNWQDVISCCTSVPNLKTLQVPFNEISNLTVPVGVLVELESLDLEGNHLKSWSEVNKLGFMPYLRRLNVSSCSLREIFFEQDQELFTSLQHLLIIDNTINDWTSLSELDKLPSLQELKCQKNPLFANESVDTNHQLVIARIKNLKVLNGQFITSEERRGAELDFLKRHGREYLNLKHDTDRIKFYTAHPCYQRLVDAYGAPEEGELIKPAASLKTALIQVELFAPQTPDQVIKKKVPINMTVQKLTGLVQRIFDTGSEVPRLFCLHSEADGVEVELDNEMKDLNFFSVENGSRIAVRW